MGNAMLPKATRTKHENRAERRNSREIINDALEEMRTEGGLVHTEAMNDIALVRRQRILSGNNPDNPIESLTLEELNASVATLGKLTSEEREQYQNAAFNAFEYEELAREAGLLHFMDANPLDELIDDGSADDYFAHDARDRMMI